MKTDQDLPPSDRAEKTKKTFTCDAATRAQLLALRAEGWSINKLASKIGMNSSVISQYLSDDGCTYPGDIGNFERKAADFLRNESRRRASGVETFTTAVTREFKTALEYVRKTNDVGVIIAESGDGKTRGLDPYMLENPTCSLFQTRIWHREESALRKFFFDSSNKSGWDKQTGWMDYACMKLRGTDRLFVFDDAHKLPVRSLQLIVDFHDETHCPISLVGTFKLLEVLEKDPQLFSRVGLKWVVGSTRPKELIKHLVQSLMPNVNGEFDQICALCEQVADQAGHFRAVHKQLKLAVEMREISAKFTDWASAFRAAHTKMMRSYTLN